MIARESSPDRADVRGDNRDRQDRVVADADRTTVRQAEDSPYLDGRAQPGDVIGLETGGESTHIGETSEDENKRRVDAERDYDKRRD